MKITPLPELTPILKQLRLSGLLDSLDTRNREAIEKKLSYPEFLALVIHDEVGRREQKKYGMRLRRAGFEQDVNDEGNPTRQRWKIEKLEKVTVDRSEERRGGKECRSRWSPYH